MNYNFNMGDVIYTPRTRWGFRYKHYGVYVSYDTVVHFRTKDNDDDDPNNALIIMTSLQEFAQGEEVFIDKPNKKVFDPEVVASRALRCLGQKKGQYSLFSNNCEHFANWCRYDNSVSYQVIETAITTVPIAVKAATGSSSLLGRILFGLKTPPWTK